MENQILSAYPEELGRLVGDIDETGEPTNQFVVRDCQQGVCAYYQWLQGTSMAAPHAAGVAALIVSQYGHRDFRNPAGGLTFPAAATENILKATASPHPCPNPPLVSYTNVGRPSGWDALCEGTTRYDGFYGRGIVDALGAVTLRGRP